MENKEVCASSRDEWLAEIVKKHQEMLLKVCFTYLCDAEEARDAVQDTFLKAYLNLESFRGECSEKSWLVKIARNTCLDICRSAWFRRVDKRIQIENLPLSTQLDAAQEEKELTLAILCLPEKLKETIVLYYFQDFTMQETADILGITQASVSSRLSRARKKLKFQLEEES